jgi:uncharacterized protein
MPRLFLDAKLLFSAAYKPDARILRLWKLEDVVLMTSRYAIEEARMNLLEEAQRQRLPGLLERFLLFEAEDASLPASVVLPDTDVPILLAAIKGRADFLLTGDFKHFGKYFGRKVGGVVIDSPAQYLKSREG